MMIRLKPRVRLAHRDKNGVPVWYAQRGPTVATGITPHEAVDNLHQMAPTRRKVRPAHGGF